MRNSGLRQAIALDASALWLEAVEVVVRRLGFEVVTKTTSCTQALAAVRKCRPQLFVTDSIVASPFDGIATIQRAHAECSNLRTVVLAVSDDPELISNALAHGASAYVVKTAHPDDLSSAIRQSFDPSVYFAGDARKPLAPVAARAAEGVQTFEDVALTKREQEILRLVAEGHSNAQLGRLLWVAEHTVKFHLRNVYRKLGVSNRTEAAHWAQMNGLLTTTQPISVAAAL